MKSRTVSATSASRPRRIGRRDRRRLPRDPLDGQRLASRRAAAPSACRCAARARARRSPARRGPSDRVTGDDAGGGHVDAQQRTPQLDVRGSAPARATIVRWSTVGSSSKRTRSAPRGDRPPARGAQPGSVRACTRMRRTCSGSSGIRLASSPSQRDAHEQIGDRPGVRDAGLIAQIVGQAADLAQDDRLVELAAHADEEHRRRAPLPRADAQRRQQQRAAPRRPPARTASSAGAAAAGASAGAGPRRGHEPERDQPRPPAPRARPRPRTPATGTSTNGAAAPAAAASASASAPPAGRAAAAARARRSATSASERPTPPTNPIGSHRQRARGSGHSGRASSRARRRRRQAQAGGRQRRRRPPGATRGQSSVSTKKRTRRPFSVRNQPSASARRTTRWRAASPSLSLDSPAAVWERPAPRQHRARAGVAARVDGDVEQAGRPEHARTPGTSAHALLGQRERLPVGGGERVVDLDGHLVQRAAARTGWPPRARARRPRRRRAPTRTDRAPRARRAPARARRTR